MFWRRKRTQGEFSEELQAHLELEADRLRGEGLSEEDAHAAAHRIVGNIMNIEERFYEANGWMWLDHLRQDVRYAMRQLRKNKGFTLVCALTLALGIGANTAVFTLVHAVMLKSLPVADPKSLYRIGDGGNCCVIGGYQGSHSIFSYALYRQLRDHTPEFAEIAAFSAGLDVVSVRRSGGQAMSQPFAGQCVSGDYFTMFGVAAYAGRALRRADDKPGAPPVAVMSYSTWQQHHALDPAVIGSTFVIDGTPVTVVGIAPPGFFGDTLRQDPPDFWIPLAVEPLMRGQNSLLKSDSHWLYLIGRLRPGAKPAAVQSELEVELKQWLTTQAGSQLTQVQKETIAKQRIRLTAGGRGIASMQREGSNTLKMLMMASGLVLLIAAANLATMLLARRAASRVQNAIRVALGAPRRRLILQSLTESVLLALVGGVAGLAVAFAGTRAILLLAFHGAKYVPIDSAPSWPVLGFAFLLSLVTGIVFGSLPAWISSHADPLNDLRGGNRSTGAHATLPQKCLVVLQAALSLVLLSGAGVLTQSLRNVEHQKFGFETDGRLIVAVSPAFTGYAQSRITTIYQQLRERLEQIPGVRSAALSLYAPMTGNNWENSIAVEGRPFAAREEDRDYSSWVTVSPHYFQTLGVHLVRGRLLDERDTPASRAVAVVNETFVRKYFKNEDPIGRHFGQGEEKNKFAYEIVGVVQDAKHMNAYEPAWPFFYLPLMQASAKEWPEVARANYINFIEVYAPGKPATLAPLIRRTIAETEANLTVVDILTFEDLVSLNFNQERTMARLTSAFGLLALLLACVGLYGLTAYSVARRTGEIGIRMALGAARGRVLSMVLRDALVLIAIGLAIGIPAELAVGRLLASQLYGVKSYDPLALGGAVVLLAGCALVAGLLPARRAAAIEPMQALRTE
ncbi:MAG TPA: ABC transporter permease [Bryobacteraceae bacterium]|nr:ABC transporter permease [Bryobacteraceae bacterium]